MPYLITNSFQSATSTPCPACDSSVHSGKYVYADGDFESRIYSCTTCSFMFGRPVFIPDEDIRQMDSVDDAEVFHSKILRLLSKKLVLNPGSLLLEIFQNIDCLGRRLFGVDWEWGLPWHCNFFNAKSLEALIGRVGLSVQKMYKTPPPLYYKDSLLRKCNSAILRKVSSKLGLWADLLLLPLPSAGALIGQGDNMTVIARNESTACP